MGSWRSISASARWEPSCKGCGSGEGGEFSIEEGICALENGRLGGGGGCSGWLERWLARERWRKRDGSSECQAFEGKMFLFTLLLFRKVF